MQYTIALMWYSFFVSYQSALLRTFPFCTFNLGLQTLTYKVPNKIPSRRVCKQTLPTISRNFRTFLPIDSCKSSTKYEKEKTKARKQAIPRRLVKRSRNVSRECNSMFMRGWESCSMYCSRYCYEITFRRIYKHVIRSFTFQASSGYIYIRLLW